MQDNIVKAVAETSDKVDEVLRILKGDDLNPGIIDLVIEHDREIKKLMDRDMKSAVSRNTLGSVAMVTAFLVPFLVFLDRMILVSEVRHAMGLYGYGAVSLSVVLDLIKLLAMIFVVVILVLRLVGWGKA